MAFEGIGHGEQGLVFGLPAKLFADTGVLVQVHHQQRHAVVIRPEAARLGPIIDKPLAVIDTGEIILRNLTKSGRTLFELHHGRPLGLDIGLGLGQQQAPQPQPLQAQKVNKAVQRPSTPR